jgi:photosynthetic reaction center cytochrome c subunit
MNARLLLLGGLLTVAACERPPVDNQQLGFRGVGMEEITNPRLDARLRAANVVPAAPAPAAPDTARVAWQNVQVLNDISAAEFTRTMNVISEWVVPDGWVDARDVKKANKCAYCHNLANMASDEVYTKVVARRMFQMTRAINANYQNHVQQTGVTCYTCHRGNAVPTNIWYFTDRYQPLRHYLDRDDIRVQTTSGFIPTNANRSSIKQTEYAYALMVNMSNALGVNCTFCHNSRQWNDWDQSSPKRITALRGIRMVRDLNGEYLAPLQSVWPANRLGPHGDGAKLQCATCHNGVSKPLYGAAMAADYPALYPHGGAAPGGDMASGDAGGAPAGDAMPIDAGAGAAGAAGMDQALPPSQDPSAGAMGGRGPTGKEEAAPPPAAGPVDKSAGAMGGRGPQGKDSLGRAPR